MINILYLHAGAEMYGADKVLLDLIRNLDKSKYNPMVVLPCDGLLVDALKKEGINTEVVKYPIMRRKYFNPKGMMNYGFDFFKYSKILLKIAKENNIDIIHTNTSAVMEGVYISRKLNIPQIWHIHEIIVKPKFMYKFTSFIIARGAKNVITDSYAVKSHLELSGFFQKQVDVIYNGVDSNYFSPTNDCTYLYEEFKIPLYSRVIGMMGRVNSWKGQHEFLEAANIIMSKHDDVYCVLIGSAFEGEEWRVDELRKKISESPFKNRIIERGYRTDSQGIYKLFDVFVLPSTNPDPLPTVVLEAMSTGKPIIGYKHGGVCEMVKENYNGLLAEVRNTKDLAEKIEYILENETLRKQMGENSRKRQMEVFSIKSFVDKFSKLYEQLAKYKIGDKDVK